MVKISLIIKRTYGEELKYEGEDILLAEALVELCKLNPKPQEEE